MNAYNLFPIHHASLNGGELRSVLHTAARWKRFEIGKVPHAICLHAIQDLCVIGVLADCMLKGRKWGAWIVAMTSVLILVSLGISLTGLS